MGDLAVAADLKLPTHQSTVVDVTREVPIDPGEPLKVETEGVGSSRHGGILPEDSLPVTPRCPLAMRPGRLSP